MHVTDNEIKPLLLSPRRYFTNVFGELAIINQCKNAKLRQKKPGKNRVFE